MAALWRRVSAYYRWIDLHCNWTTLVVHAERCGEHVAYPFGRYDHADRSGSTGGKGFFETRFLVDGPRTLIVYGVSPNGDRRNGHGKIESQRLEYRNRMVARHRVPLRLDSFLGEPRFANGHPVRVNTRPWRLTVSSIRN